MRFSDYSDTQGIEAQIVRIADRRARRARRRQRVVPSTDPLSGVHFPNLKAGVHERAAARGIDLEASFRSFMVSLRRPASQEDCEGLLDAVEGAA